MQNTTSDKTSQDNNIEESPSSSKAKSFVKELIGWIIPMVIAVVAATFINRCVLINAIIPTGSMLNTIQKYDKLFGFRLAYMFSEPERGDIMIFKNPDNPAEDYIKRTIGLPGEKITIKDAKIYINDSTTPLDEPYLKEEWIVGTGPYVFNVPEDCYLMLGDNRNNSKDARYWENTYVEKEAIVGKAFLIYYPFKNLKLLD